MDRFAFCADMEHESKFSLQNRLSRYNGGNKTGYYLMKIEKINDRQIRCVLTKDDLENRKIRLSELVCGGEKARGLFRDMMLKASSELGFSFNNNPLMIEAVPTGKDQLVLIITRVDDPGELDSRFKRLTGGDFFRESDQDKKDGGKKEPEEKRSDAFFYLFRSLENVIGASKRVPEDYKGENALYKNPDDGAYYLLLKRTETKTEQFNRICNVLSEYSMPMDYSTGMDEFFHEHMKVIIPKQALQHLRGV